MSSAMMSTETFILTCLSALMVILMNVIIYGGIIYLFVLLIKALRKYLRSNSPRNDDIHEPNSLGATLKAHRTRCQMTQEFVADQLNVSRQAVSKWESGTSSPSTSNLLALAKLFEISPDELLHSVQK